MAQAVEQKKILVMSTNKKREYGRDHGIPGEEGHRPYPCLEYQLVDFKHDKPRFDYLPSLLGFIPSTTTAVLDNFVYIFGGLSPSIIASDDFKLLQSNSAESHKKFYMGASSLDLDLYQSQGKPWTPAPVPIENPSSPRCITLFGKIYIFGARLFEPEVFDPCVGHWESLCSTLPPELVGCSVSNFPLPDPSNHRIIFHLYGGPLSKPSLYAYNPPDHPKSGDKPWEFIVKFNGWTHVAAVADNVIYFHSCRFPSTLSAFDLASHTWLELRWFSTFEDGLDLNESGMDFDALFHLGDSIFCYAVWTPKQLAGTEIFFPKFRVERVGETISLIPLSSHSYMLPATSEVRKFLLV